MRQNKTGRFLVVAPSARALARSVVGAGYACEAIDLFADQDTRQLCHVVRAGSLDEALQRLAQVDRQVTLVLGGGLENRMDLLLAVAGDLPVCGCSPVSIQKVRNPFRVKEVLQRAGLPCPDLRRERPAGGSWIVKPFRSAGGQNVFHLDSVPKTFCDDGCFYQDLVSGPVYGASFVAAGDGCQLVGVARQMVEPLGSDPFLYRGSVGPVGLPEPTVEWLRKIGTELARAFDLRGWFGLDFALREDVPMLLEVNPRYTASMELFENLAGESLFARHLAAVSGVPDGTRAAFLPATDRISVRRYVFQRQAVPWTVEPMHLAAMKKMEQPSSGISIADIPHAGTTIPPGHPICTILVTGHDEKTLVAVLGELEDQISGWAIGPPGPSGEAADPDRIPSSRSSRTGRA